MKRVFIGFLAVLLMVPYLFTQPGNSQARLLDKVSLDPLLEETLKTVSSSTSLEVIVTFKGDGPPTENQINLLEDLGISTGLSMESLPIAGVVATKSQIEKLQQSDEVLSVYKNTPLELLNQDSTELTGVQKVRTDDDFRRANGGLPVSGKGIGVVVNDSGVDGTHNDHKFGENLVQNVLATTNLNAVSSLLPVTYTENVINTDTNSGHGTHVAGTIGGTGAQSGGKYEGVAPGADLIGYGSGGVLLILDGIGGFDYAITNQAKYGIRVINNSWGSSGSFDPYHPINVASKKAYDRGIVTVFAAGNSGPGENTHNPYAKAPWVISVGAGVKDGSLANFSSRGTQGKGGTFEMDGEEWTWTDRPTVTAPGVDIISTRVLAPLSALAVDNDAEMIETAYLPYYTTMSGTSMAAPHVAGIVALMLEANPLLSPSEVKEILEQTATNMPGMEPWEVGAGYVNAYAAVDAAINGTEYGQTLNMNQTFNSSVKTQVEESSFEVDFNPLLFLSDNSYEFEVAEGVANITAQVDGRGLMEETGNPINLVLIDPNGEEYSSGISLLFAIDWTRTVSVSSPIPGKWQAEIRGLRGDEINPFGTALPETVNGTLRFTTVGEYSGLDDIAGHEAEGAIQLGISERLFDGKGDGTFAPDEKLSRADLAKFLVMGAGIRQSKGHSFSDLRKIESSYIEAVTAKGSALRDIFHQQNPVVLPKEEGKFAPNSSVTREELAYSLVQSLGLQELALEHEGDLTVQYGNDRIKLDDGNQVSDHLKGYVQVALDLNILNAQFSVTQGRFDLRPTVHASFSPQEEVTRGDFAVAMTRFYQAYLR
ncbi:serine protease AprX [Evansella vedderi]|uniref:Serine protease AprX n=1 Tax=Evansella vedderi TaxID=38282 RepID=A0ABT9ZZG5_9BACI|nr:S8 family serine peptidase [Evansella vedderi]MDQ0256638.1 serine protease AprX [Evansella vedderi]